MIKKSLGRMFASPERKKSSVIHAQAVEKSIGCWKIHRRGSVFSNKVCHLWLWGFSHWKNEVGTIAAASARLFYVLLHVSFQFFSCVSLFMCVFRYLAFCFMLLVSLDAVAAVKDRQELTTRTTLMPQTKQVETNSGYSRASKTRAL